VLIEGGVDVTGLVERLELHSLLERETSRAFDRSIVVRRGLGAQAAAGTSEVVQRALQGHLRGVGLVFSGRPPRSQKSGASDWLPRETAPAPGRMPLLELGYPCGARA
jgi:hypothetical protein